MKPLRSLVGHRWAIPAVSGTLIAMSLGLERALEPSPWTSLLMICAAVVAGHRIALDAGRALLARTVGIDLLVTAAAVGAIIIENHWEAAAVTFLFSVGHTLEKATMNKTRSALAELVAMAPDVAVVLRDGHQVEVPARRVEPGETVLVTNGAKVPVDGEVLAGTGTIDEATITGESIPVEKLATDRVFAGTVSRGGFLQVRATGVGADTSLARIIHRVEEAQDAKARTQTFLDRFSRWYTPAVMALALVAGLATRDVVLALTLLVIACPGALVISIPVAIVAGIGHAARRGILIKGGEFLETSARIDAVAVDKTGTLTQGRPRLTDIVAFGGFDRDDVLRWAAYAEAGSEHPLAKPVLTAAQDAGIALAVPTRVQPLPGRGIAADVRDRRVLVGNLALLEQFGVPDGVGADAMAHAFALQGRTPLIVAVDGDVAGVIAVADTVRADARQMVRELHDAGVAKVVMLTGDVAPVADAIGRATGIDEIHAGLLPEQKLEAVRQLQRDGYTVAMVGDGVNDAPALATADIGVAMGAAGSAVAVETADIALMGDDLSRLPESIRLARRTVAVMRQNIVMALVTVLALMVGVFVGGVTMAIGMLVHELSVLVVIANAMRLSSWSVLPPGGPRSRPSRGCRAPAQPQEAKISVR